MLTNTAIINAKPMVKPYRISDSGGLYLQVNTSGSKCWRMKYRFTGKEKVLSFGTYPLLTLAEAREKRDQAKKNLLNNIDPGLLKQHQKHEAIKLASITFALVAEEWHEKNKVKWTDKTAQRLLSLLNRYISPFVGHLPIHEIRASDILRTVQRIEARGNYETAHRALQLCGQVFRYAIASDKATQDVTLALKGALMPTMQKHHASITDEEEITHLMRNIHHYIGTFSVCSALKLAPLLFVRMGELRNMEWAEINFDAAKWKIPAEKMKMRTPHIVPLSKQALQILKEMHQHTGHLKYVFTSVTSIKRPMSENTINAALRRMGYDKETMTGHGFRSMASTVLHEHSWPEDAIERQLAHNKKDKVSGAYDYAKHLPKRIEMMQYWSDYLYGK